MDFATISIITTVVAALLGLGWLFAGSLLLRRWGVPADASALLVGRRIGAIYVGLAVLLFLARGIQRSEAQMAVATGFAIALVLLGGVGVLEFVRGRATKGILISTAIEFLLAAGFVSSAVAAR
jgi:hypothetical protein